MQTTPKRILFIDHTRGFAVLLMIIFHFCYDLSYFKYIKINIVRDPFWYYFPRLIVFLFLIAMGLSFPLSHAKKINWDRFFKRFALIAGAAIIISVTTFYMFPKNWIYFGTLHCISICSLMILPFYNRPLAAMGVSLFIMISHLSGLIIWPWVKMNHESLDYIPALPWVSIVLLGVFLHHKGFHFQMDNLLSRFSKTFIGKSLAYMGKHSLIIYLVHQPILFSSLYLFYTLTNAAK